MDVSILRQNLDTCLLGKAERWYTEELSNVTRVGLRGDLKDCEEWCKALETRF